MKKLLFSLALCALQPAGAQTLEKMHWFNEPERWSIADGTLTVEECDKAMAAALEGLREVGAEIRK